MNHPMQPIEYDKHGIIRFRRNKIVEYLLDNGGIDLNHLAVQDFSDEDRMQFAQLIGYSVGGFGDLFYASDEVVGEADRIAAELYNSKED